MGPVSIGAKVQRNTDGDTPSNDIQASIIEAFNSTSRYLDDLLKTDNPYYERRMCIKPVFCLPQRPKSESYCSWCCGSSKKRPRKSSIVQFIFYFWSFEISRNILRNQKILKI